uniref:Serpentine receptor class gamma n=1 Tax=Ditylenchus dipsaci TaxID=166011 RepID=A0A915DYF8_9BILA
MAFTMADFLAYFPLLYTVPSILLNIVLFYVLLSKFKSPFYIIFTINGITSNIWAMTGFLRNRAMAAPTLFGLFRALPVTGPLLTIWFFLNYMLKQDKIWRYLLPISLGLAYVVAIGLNVPILVNGAWLRSPNDTNNFYILESFSMEVEIRQSAYGIGAILAFFPASLVMNCKIALFLWKTDAEAKLCFITFTLLVTNFVGLVCQVWFFVAGVTKTDMSPSLVLMLGQIGTYAEDLHLFSQPWMLIAMSSAVREELKSLFFCGQKRNINDSRISVHSRIRNYHLSDSANFSLGFFQQAYNISNSNRSRSKIYAYTATINNLTSSYQISDQSGTLFQKENFSHPILGLSTNLTICVFSDYRNDWMNDTHINITQLVLDNHCNLNLFIGRIVFEEQKHGISFNPFVMLGNNDNIAFNQAFGGVPSIFGGVGHNLRETKLFHR